MRRSLSALIALSLAGCASATDVAERGRVVLNMTDPDKLGYCPAELIAKARTEVAFAQAAAQRGEPIAAKGHLDAAERYAADVRDKRGACVGREVRDLERPIRD